MSPPPYLSLYFSLSTSLSLSLGLSVSLSVSPILSGPDILTEPIVIAKATSTKPAAQPVYLTPHSVLSVLGSARLTPLTLDFGNSHVHDMTSYLLS